MRPEEKPSLISGRIDAHCHLWRRARGDYGWLEGGGEDLDPLRRDFELGDLAVAASIFGVDASVLVQAAPTLAETRFLLDHARAEPRRIAGVVGWVDLEDAASVATLEALATDPKFLGVRPMLQDLPAPDWIATRPVPACVAALTRLGLRFDALVTPVQLPALLRFVEANDGLAVMIDHAAKPAFGASQDDPRHAWWRDSLRALARFPRVFCKMSGLLTELPPEKRQTQAEAVRCLQPLVDDLLEWFGPDRLAWGSDWPVLTLAGSPGEWMATTDALLARLSHADRAAILGNTATRFYRLDERAVG